jgi:hypothetical protein
MASRVLLQAMQLRAFREAIPEHGDGYCYGTSMYI